MKTIRIGVIQVKSPLESVSKGLIVLALVAIVAFSSWFVYFQFFMPEGEEEISEEEVTTVKSIDSVVSNNFTIPRYGLFELTVNLTTFVVDPYRVRLSAHFTSPSGRNITIYCFASHAQWKVRFTPTEVGNYSYYLTTDEGKEDGLSTTPQTFTCVDSDNRGFIRISENNGRYFIFDNGEPFFLIGINKGWIFDTEGNRGDGYPSETMTHWNAERYFVEMEAHGINLVRVWMCSWHLNIESKTTKLGRYDENEADKLDYLLQLCERYKVRLMLVFLTFTDFSSIHGSKFNDDNPYSSTNGGPCNQPVDFFTNEKAKWYIKKRIGYILNRWGHSPYIFAWELWNEVDLVSGAEESHWLPWHEEIAEHIRQHDPYGHSITTSLSGDKIFLNTFRSNAVDIVQLHTYKEDYGTKIAEVLKEYLETLVTYGKPVLIGEFGTKIPTQKASHTHNGIWSSVALGSSGSALVWSSHIRDDYGDMTDEMFDSYLSLSRFVSDLNFSSPNVRPAVVSIEGGGITAYGTTADKLSIIWLTGGDPTTELKNLMVNVSDLSSGKIGIVWYDDHLGVVISMEEGQVIGGKVRLQAPPFREGLALKITFE